MIRELTIDKIIKRKIDFLEQEEAYQEEERIFYKQGVLRAYQEMIVDVEEMQGKNFITKYLAAAKELELKMGDEERSWEGTEAELDDLEGYFNTVIEILAVFHPEYEYELEEIEEVEGQPANITVSDIIQRKIQYLENDETMRQDDYLDYKDGNVRSYLEMLEDSKNMSESEFVEKYIEISKRIGPSVDRYCDEEDEVQKEMEILMGCRRAMYEVLILIHPKYEHEI